MKHLVCKCISAECPHATLGMRMNGEERLKAGNKTNSNVMSTCCVDL